MTELEQRVIATLLSKPELVDVVGVNADWFEDTRLKNVLEVLQSLEVNERTTLNVYSELDKYEGQFSYSDLENMRESVFSTASITNDVKALHKLAAKKQLDEAVVLYQMSPKKEELNRLSSDISEP